MINKKIIAIPHDQYKLQRFVEKTYKQVANNRIGELATYIPELANAPKDAFEIGMVTLDGNYYHSNHEPEHRFSIQSVCKPFIYALALKKCGEEKVKSCVGVQPFGGKFNSKYSFDKKMRPLNPMINAGALTIINLLFYRFEESTFDKILSFFRLCTNNPKLTYDKAVYNSERHTGTRNYYLAGQLANTVKPSVAEKVLDIYFKVCSIKVSTKDLAIMTAMLANSGKNPMSKIQVIPEHLTKKVLTTMLFCGMYDYSGEWAHQVGIPAKSGVSGDIIAVAPGKFGIAVYSPRLDSHFNSVRGVDVCTRLSQHNMSKFPGI